MVPDVRLDAGVVAVRGDQRDAARPAHHRDVDVEVEAAPPRLGGVVPGGSDELDELWARREAETTFGGAVTIAREGAVYEV